MKLALQNFRATTAQNNREINIVTSFCPSLLVGHFCGEYINKFWAWFLASRRFCCWPLASQCIVGWCGGTTETSVGGRMCDWILGLHVTGVAVYRQIRGNGMALRLTQAYLECSFTTELPWIKLISKRTATQYSDAHVNTLTEETFVILVTFSPRAPVSPTVRLPPLCHTHPLHPAALCTGTHNYL